MVGKDGKSGPRASLGRRGSQPRTAFALPGSRPAEPTARGCGGARPRPDPARPRPGPGRYRPRLPRLCLGVSPPASWQRSLRHWKSNRNPAASLLLRSLAIARSLPRQLSGCGSARLLGGGAVRGRRSSASGRRAALCSGPRSYTGRRDEPPGPGAPGRSAGAEGGGDGGAPRPELARPRRSQSSGITARENKPGLAAKCQTLPSSQPADRFWESH